MDNNIIRRISIYIKRKKFKYLIMKNKTYKLSIARENKLFKIIRRDKTFYII